MKAAGLGIQWAWLAAAAVGISGCDLKLDASREIPSGLANRIAQKQAELMSSPDAVALHVELGQLFMEAERYFDAAESLQTAKSKGAETSALHAGLAETYLELGYFRPCADELRACFQKNRDEPGCLYVFGMLMEGIEDRQALMEAQRAYGRLLQVAPDFRKAKLASSSLDQVNARLSAMPQAASQPAPKAAAPGTDPHAGVPNAPPVPAAAPAEPAAPDVPGHTSKVDPATGKDVGELNPFGVAIMKAVEAVRKNDAPAAEAAFAEALKIHPDEASALAGLAEAQMAQGKTDAAVASIEKAYAVDAKDPQVRWAFGNIMLQTRKRTEEAVKAWTSLVQDEPEYAKQLGIPARLEALSKFGK